MDVTETITTIAVLGGIGGIIYTKVKNQTLKDTWEEVRELFRSDEVLQSGF